MRNPGLNIVHPKARGEWAEMRFMARAAEHGLAIAKPFGDMARYDFITEHNARFLRVQVKCTSYKRQNSYVCTICSNHIPYRAQDLDFLAAYVIPADAWYILPIRATNCQASIVLSPHHQNSRYSPYREAWHLLLGRGMLGEIVKDQDLSRYVL